jgi:ribosomal protein S28E/S33
VSQYVFSVNRVLTRQVYGPVSEIKFLVSTSTPRKLAT